MPQHDDVAVSLHGSDGILERLTFRGAGVLPGGLGGQDPAAELAHGALEGEARARGRLVEQGGHVEPLQHPRSLRSGLDLRHRVGDDEELLEHRRVELLRLDAVRQVLELGGGHAGHGRRGARDAARGGRAASGGDGAGYRRPCTGDDDVVVRNGGVHGRMWNGREGGFGCEMRRRAAVTRVR